MIYEKEVNFVPKTGKIVAKINGVLSSYKINTATAKYNRKKNQNRRKISTEFILSKIIDGIKIKLIEKLQFKVNK